MGEAIDASVVLLSIFGGISLVVWTSMQAKIAGIKAETLARRPQSAAEAAPQPQDGAVLAEIKALKQQVAEMNSTSHAFDLSFDEALNRLEGRVGRIETKSAAQSAAPEAPAAQRNGSVG